uniref:Gypsy retrotransposon integrase-like protein 1 n=1 Tax=Neogobius melanostomus TaxID=47308 RepID=A0A8C6URA0_9GOBI
METRQQKKTSAEAGTDPPPEGELDTIPEEELETIPEEELEVDGGERKSTDMEQLTDLLHRHMRDQETRWRRMEEDLSHLHQEVQQSRKQPMEVPSEWRKTQDVQDDQIYSRHSSTMQNINWKGPKMQPYTDGEDIEHYLCIFERIAHACQWPCDEWALCLAPLLTGKARSAYVAMDIDDTMNYYKVKRAVLQKFEISTVTYRLRFRSLERKEEETPQELQVRLKELYNKWLDPKTKTKEQIGDAIIMEQFLKVISPELRTWIKERDPKTSKEAADMAEAFLAARRPSNAPLAPKPRPPTPFGKTFGPYDSKPHQFRPSTAPHYAPRLDTRDRSTYACHLCGVTGHLKAQCPKATSSKKYLCSVSNLHGDMFEGQREELTTGVVVDDKPCIALLDSGSDRTLIRQDSLPKDVVFCGGTMDIVCIHGDKVRYPIAEVTIQLEGQSYVLSVGVLEHLPYQIVLGLDVPILPELIAKQSVETTLNSNDCLMAVTRSKSNQKDSPTAEWEELPFANDEIVTANNGKVRKSKRQKRQDKVKGTKIDEHVLNPSEPDLFSICSDVAALQKDPSLAPLFNKCVSETTKVTGCGKDVFVIKGDKLYRRSELSDQLVVPQSLRPTILHLSHSVPWSGHLGQAKTFSRMIKRFYWPQQYSDTVKYCQSCPECQLTAPNKKGDRAPLISMPIIDTPFS